MSLRLSIKKKTMIEHLYLHVPFCQSICHYCDFCHRLYDEEIVNKWLAELAKEIDSYHINNNLKTIYIGGGTPSSLSCWQLDKLLNLLKPYQREVIEYTVEVNPESIDIDKIKILKKYGVNRISIGVEAVQDRLLKLMNRKHNFQDVQRIIDLFIKEGIDNISCDLMYSLPSQTIDEFKDSLVAVSALPIKHLSLYSLTIEDNTVFGKLKYEPLDEDIEADMYEMAVKYLEEKDFKQYEISNFAKDNAYSRHNLAYWTYKDFYGLSLGASGKIDNYRYDNTRSFKEYFEGKYLKEKVVLSIEDMMFEEIMMSLRLKKGLDLKRFESRYGLSFFVAYKKPYLSHVDDFVVDNNFLRVKNIALLNSILVDFL